MCLLVILWRVVEEAPLIVAANREEAYARGGTPPQVVIDAVRFVGGLDPQAGGTWLGVNEHGLLVAVTNRAKTDVPPHPRSRGLLVRDLLRCPNARQASAEAVRELGSNRYAGCNLFGADLRDAYVVHAGNWLRVQPLPPGIHVLAVGDLNDATDPRVAYARNWLHARAFASAAEWLEALKELCAFPGSEGAPPMCIRGDLGGTVSSSLLALRTPLAQSSYGHAQGPPDQTPYEDYSHLIRSLS